MTKQLKVDNIVDTAGTGKPNFPVSPTSGGAALSTLNHHSYTSSATEPSSPKNGAIWWDSANNKVYVYANGEFKEIVLNTDYPSAYGASAVTWGGTRGLRFGGKASGAATDTIDYYDISATGNATDFGNLVVATMRGSAASSGSRAFKAGGVKTAGGTANVNSIEYITTATTGNGTDFGDLTQSVSEQVAVSDSTRGCICGGWNEISANSAAYTDRIEYITIASTGNATDQANLVSARGSFAGWNDSTRAVIGGGTTATTNQIQYFTIQTTSNALDFGDLGETWQRASGAGDDTRMLFMGGRRTFSGNSNHWSNAIEYVTIQTTGNATDFGDLSNYCDRTAPASDGTYACVAGGEVGGSASNVIDRVTVQTTGNATDHGDLTQAMEDPNGASGSAS